MEPKQLNQLLSAMVKEKKGTLDDSHVVNNVEKNVILDKRVTLSTTNGLDRELILLQDKSLPSSGSEKAIVATAIEGTLTSVANGWFDGYYSIFGYQISKTTVILGLVFMILSVLYYVFKT